MQRLTSCRRGERAAGARRGAGWRRSSARRGAAIASGLDTRRRWPRRSRSTSGWDSRRSPATTSTPVVGHALLRPPDGEGGSGRSLTPGSSGASGLGGRGFAAAFALGAFSAFSTWARRRQRPSRRVGPSPGSGGDRRARHAPVASARSPGRLCRFPDRAGAFADAVSSSVIIVSRTECLFAGGRAARCIAENRHDCNRLVSEAALFGTALDKRRRVLSLFAPAGRRARRMILGIGSDLANIERIGAHDRAVRRAVPRPGLYRDRAGAGRAAARAGRHLRQALGGQGGLLQGARHRAAHGDQVAGHGGRQPARPASRRCG